MSWIPFVDSILQLLLLRCRCLFLWLTQLKCSRNHATKNREMVQSENTHTSTHMQTMLRSHWVACLYIFDMGLCRHRIFNQKYFNTVETTIVATVTIMRLILGSADIQFIVGIQSLLFLIILIPIASSFACSVCCQRVRHSLASVFLIMSFNIFCNIFAAIRNDQCERAWFIRSIYQDDGLEDMRQQTMNRLFTTNSQNDKNKGKLRSQDGDKTHWKLSTQPYSRVKISMNIYAFMCAKLFS